MTRPLRPLALFTALIGLLAGMAGLGVRPAHAATTSITIDGAKPGRVFDGVGAISGGGGNSRLLIDYPEPQRSQLLDYLFKPGYGAALQLLKLEVGGETNSTDGAEASHERTQGAVDCNQGYQWWLAEQAKARNPGIKLYGLAWGAPGWVDPRGKTFYTDNSIDYLMDWIGCAAQHHLSIDYLGGWNERGSDLGWYKKLKAALRSHGYGTKVVANDDFGWGAKVNPKDGDSGRVIDDPELNDAADIVGSHYICGHLKPADTCEGDDKAKDLGKPLWHSEGGSQDTDSGAGEVARSINRGYIDARTTAFLHWPVIAALYPNLDFSSAGMAVANQPWSGHYSIGKTTWAMAHTTQFAQPGWRYIDSASGYLGGDRRNGSYVSLKSATGSDYSTVIETVGVREEQEVSVTVTGGLSTGPVHVWATDLNSDNPSGYLVHTDDLTPSDDGTYTLTLQPGRVYTLTTTTGQGKGTATAPPASPLALPHSDDFETPAGSTSPRYFSDMNGAFATVACGGGREGTCLRQMTPREPIRWTDESYNAPYTIMGDQAWGDYTVTSDVMLERPGNVVLMGRIGKQARNNNSLDAYHLRVSNTGEWSILKSASSDPNSEEPSWDFTTLASGTTGDAALGTGSWHKVAFTLQGSTLTASVDGEVIGEATDTTYSKGQAGLGVDGYHTGQFDNFTVTRA